VLKLFDIEQVSNSYATRKHPFLLEL